MMRSARLTPRADPVLRLGDTLSVLLPTPDETALLAACLQSGPPARAAWARWRAARGRSDDEVRRQLAATRALVPLLGAAAARNGLDVSRGVLPYLRAAVLREELRAARVREITAAALTRLRHAGATTWVVRGVALAATVYEAWALRHCHDVDLLVRPDQLVAAVEALAGVGSIEVAPAPRTGAVVRHASGLRVALHTRPFALGYYDAPVDRFVRGARTVAIDGVTAATTSAETTLVHVLGHATYSPRRASLRWVVDAWQLVTRHPRLDWDDVCARIGEHRLALPVSVLLGYLAALGMSVPGPVLAHLADAAARAPRAAEDVALGGAYVGPRGALGNLWRATRSWRGRVRLAGWAVAPSPSHLRDAYDPSEWLLPLCYLYRPARFLARRVPRRSTRRPA